MVKSSQRTVLITGARGGLGRAMAHRLAAEGHRLVLTDALPMDDLLEEADIASAVAYSAMCDLESEQAVAKFATGMLETTQVDAVINNAALQVPVPFEDLTEDVLKRYMKINVEAPYRLIRACEPGMSERGWGRIINFYSSTVYKPPATFLAYSTSKMAMVGLTNSLAVELGDRGITVNAISPALTRHAQNWDAFPQEVWDAGVADQAIKRQAVPEDITGLIAFLLTDEAGFITGQKFNVDGGHNLR